MTRFEALQEVLLYCVWNSAAARGSTGAFTLWNLEHIRPSGASYADTRKAIDALVSRGLLDLVDEEDGAFEISRSGVSHVELAMSDRESVISKYAGIGDAEYFPDVDSREESMLGDATYGGEVSWFGASDAPRESFFSAWDDAEFDEDEWDVDRFQSVLDGIPASDRVVSLNHNSFDYKQSVAALDEVVREFREDHRLENLLGQEKPALLQALEGAQVLLRDHSVRIEAAKTLILQPLLQLGRLAKKYDHVLVGAAVNTAFLVITKLLGLL